MIIVNIDSTCVRCGGIWQYDYGQILRIQNLKLPPAVEIHFSLEERGGQSITRVGTTKDGVTDVVIPDSMLENGDITTDYKIYAFIYLTDSESGQTEYKISMSVKSRPRPESFERQEDAELFRTAIAEVNKSATSAQESATKSATAKDESIAASKEAKQSAEEASTSAQASKTSANASKESADIASSAAKASISAKEIAVSAADSADSNALAASRSAQEAQTNAEQADTASKSAAQSKQDIQELKTAIDNTAEQIATDRTAVETDKEEVQKAKSDVEDLKSAVEQKSSEALVDLENTEVVIKKNINDLKDVVIEKGNEAISGIETARDNAINDVNTAKDTAVNTITQEKESAVNAVNDAKDNVVAEINKNENVQQIKENKDDIAEAQTDIEELKDKKITKFYANNLGETHLKDSDSGKIQDMFLYGKSEQKQYTGKNLLELSDNRVQNGNLKFQISQGIITFSGSTDNASFIEKIKDFIVPSDGTYTISTNSDSDNEFPRILLSINGGSFESALNGATKELTTADVVSLYIRISTIDSYNGRTIKPMIEKGSEVTSYEPYTGGQPSPSPDYPQEIKSVVNPVVKIHGKNLLPFPYADKSKVANGVTFDVMNDGRVHVFGTATGNAYINLSEGIEWSDESFSSSTSNGIKLIGNLFYNKDNKILSHCVNTGNTVDYVLSPMVLLENETNRSYEQYKEQVVNLPYTLNAIPVKNGGNITIDDQQYIADYVDIEKGKLVKLCRIDNICNLFRIKSINNADPKWWDNNISDCIEAEPKAKFKQLLNGDVGKCSHFKSYSFGDFYNKKIELGIVNSETYVVINVPKSFGLTTMEKWKEFLKDVTILKPLKNSEEIDLTQEEIKAFKELATYYPVTNVSITSDQLDGYTTFNYPVSMKNGWDYVKQQLGDTRDYIYDVDKKAQDIDTQSAEAYVNSEYAVALTELEVM